MNQPTKLPDTDTLAAQRRSYLLRLWCTGESGCREWRASLEDPHSGERVGFSNLEHLFAYLMEVAEASEGAKVSIDRAGAIPRDRPGT